MSLQTVKKHVRSIYRKLEVTSPAEAVAKATALGLLPFDFAPLLQPMRDRRELNYNPLAQALLTGISNGQQEGWAEPMQ